MNLFALRTTALRVACSVHRGETGVPASRAFQPFGISRSVVRSLWSVVRISAFCFLLFALSSFAQNVPRIGYVFPPGGKQGTTFSVVVGGQFIEPATNVVFGGDGLSAEVVDFHKPMPQGIFNNLRDKMRELQDKKQAWNKAVRQGNPPPATSTNAWAAADEKQLTEIREKILKNPPNRNATAAIAEVATLRVTIDADAAPGDREIRLGAPGALSNPLRFCVGQLPEFSKPPAQAPNPDADRFRQQFAGARPSPPASAKTELRVTPPVIINGQIMPGVVDRYRFYARRGQQFIIAASARELIPYIADAVPGWFQAALTLLDAKGREVAYNDDFRFRPDPVLLCTIPADGEYVLEVKDAIFRGREDFVYCITLGELPFITGVFPLGATTGSVTQVEVSGWNLPTNVFSLDAQNRSEGTSFFAIADGTNLLGTVPFAVDALPDTLEAEPNDSPRQAQTVVLPVIVNGRIQKPGDADVFKIRGRAGETIVAEVTARRLDSPLDGVLKLTDAAGKQIAFNDDNEDKASGLNTHHADPRISVTLPADGEYFLRLTDTQNKGGSEYAYRLRLSAPRPDFALRLVPSAINLRGGANAAVTVYALRRDGFTNEIALALKDAPPGVSLSGGKIQAGQDQVKVTLSAPAMPEDERFALRMEGRATINGVLVTREVVPADDLMQAFFYRHLVPAQEMRVSVAGRFGQRGVIKILSSTPVAIPLGGTARVKVALPRGPLMDRVQFELADAPDGIALASVTRMSDGTEFVFQADAGKLKPEATGNLIINAVVSRAPGASGRPGANRRNNVGVLPAIPFKIIPATGP